MPTLLQDGSTRYIAGPDGLPLEQIDGNGNVQYYPHDQLGSTRALLDGAGNAVGTYSYDAYGAPTTQTGGASTPFGYAGQYTDAETGLQYLRARYYDPATSQFVSADPFADVTGQPYAYTADDPLNGVDPAGLCTVDVPVLGRQHFPGSDNRSTLCSEELKLKLHDSLLAASSGLARFNQSDLSNAVYGDVTRLARAGQGLYDQAALCTRGWQAAAGCAQATAAFASYAQAHPWELGVVVVQAQVAQLAQYKQYKQELDCHQYGAIAGHLLVAFALSKGTGVVGGAVRGAVGDAATTDLVSMANKGSRLVHILRPQALQDVLREIDQAGANIWSDEDAVRYLDNREVAHNISPGGIHASTLGDTIAIRPQFVDNVRVLREELIHVFQQRAGMSSNEADIVAREIEARLQIISHRHDWSITNSEVRDMVQEVRQMRATGKY